MKSTKCQSCGFVGFSATGNCKSCGAPFIERPSPVIAPRPNYGPTNPTPQQGQKKGMAIFALVLGILGFMTFGFIGVGAIVGIILAVIAMNRAGRQPWIYGGRSLAIAALVLNITSLTMGVPIGIIAAIAIPNLLASRRAANEGSAISTMRTVFSAEATYQSIFQRYGTLQELASEQLIDPALARGFKNGYTFNLEITRDADNLEGFKLVGMPTTYQGIQGTGKRSFFVDETGVIRGADAQGGPSTEFDPPLQSYYDYRRTTYRDQ